MPPSLTTAGKGRGQKADEWSRPYVLPARLDRGVDVLHDPVFNKVRAELSAFPASGGAARRIVSARIVRGGAGRQRVPAW